jgi:hypothetical protein
MKSRFALLFFLVLCSAPAFARVHHYMVRQLYRGDAKPRAGVAWIWLDYGVRLTDLDGEPVAENPKVLKQMSMAELRCASSTWVIAELLPGNHEIMVVYNDYQGHTSKFKLPLKVDAKAAGNYAVHANFKVTWTKGDNWNPVITDFTPDADSVPVCRE